MPRVSFSFWRNASSSSEFAIFIVCWTKTADTTLAQFQEDWKENLTHCGCVVVRLSFRSFKITWEGGTILTVVVLASTAASTAIHSHIFSHIYTVKLSHTQPYTQPYSATFSDTQPYSAILSHIQPYSAVLSHTCARENVNILVCCYIVHWFTLGPLGHAGVMWDLCWVYVELGWFMLGSCWCKNGGFGPWFKWACGSGVMLGPCWGYVGPVCGISCMQVGLLLAQKGGLLLGALI